MESRFETVLSAIVNDGELDENYVPQSRIEELLVALYHKMDDSNNDN